MGAGEECVECHAEVEAFSLPSAAPIRGLALMGCNDGRVAGGRGLSGADATAAGVVQLESVGCAYRRPSAFVEAVVMESAEQGEVGQDALTSVGSVADVVDFEVAAAGAAGDLAAVLVACFDLAT